MSLRDTFFQHWKKNLQKGVRQLLITWHFRTTWPMVKNLALLKQNTKQRF